MSIVTVDYQSIFQVYFRIFTILSTRSTLNLCTLSTRIISEKPTRVVMVGCDAVAQQYIVSRTQHRYEIYDVLSIALKHWHKRGYNSQHTFSSNNTNIILVQCKLNQFLSPHPKLAYRSLLLLLKGLSAENFYWLKSCPFPH